MRVFLLAAAMIALLAGPSYAQSKATPKYGETDKEKSAVEKEADREAERAYKPVSYTHLTLPTKA